MKFSSTLLFVTATVLQALASPVPGDEKHYELEDIHGSFDSVYYAQGYSDYDNPFHEVTYLKENANGYNAEEHENYHTNEYYMKDMSNHEDKLAENYEAEDNYDHKHYKRDDDSTKYSEYGVDQKEEKYSDFVAEEYYNDGRHVYDQETKYAEKYKSYDDKYYRRDHYSDPVKESYDTDKHNEYKCGDKEEDKDSTKSDKKYSNGY
ncbi:hypothetical protein HDU79_004298 [Rhizoclosmatium sp. JEL0117]|nr:hypothetical protein HDU79_004298 [Rhizoclosmatium sp. JEL0117]